MARHIPSVETIAAGSAAVLAAFAGVAVWLRRRKPDADALEARRRDHLFHVGRIIDGTVVDIRNEDDGADPAITRHLVCYRYRIYGVQYDCAQDVTALAAQMQHATSGIGFPVSVRYDPANPSNSIVVCEKWLGLHNNPIRPANAVAPRANRHEGLRSAS